MAYEDDEDFEHGEGIEATPASLAHWLEESYQGDDRFESIATLDPAPLEGEALRVRFVCPSQAYFFVSVFEDDALVRIGLATEDQDQSEAIENAATEGGQSLSEFLQEAIELDDELEYEVQHFHDDAYYFCSEIPYQRTEDLAGDILREQITYYLDAYMNAFFELIEGDED